MATDEERPDYEDEPVHPWERLYDDDDFFFSNVKAGEMNEEQYQVAVANQRLFEASTWDLMKELSTRFDDFVFSGKRKLEERARGNDRDEKRATAPRTDNRLMVQGDIHTLSGLSHEVANQIQMAMDMSYPNLRIGFGPDDTDIEQMDDMDVQIDLEDNEGDEWKEDEDK